MTLNETWKNCLAMWKWIAEQIRTGDKRSVDELKRAWVRDHGFEDVMYYCFFCDYVVSKSANCGACPARLIDPKFGCRRAEYDFFDEPIKFYEKLVALNKERIANDPI